MLTPELQKISEAYENTMFEISIRLRYAVELRNGKVTTGLRTLDFETVAMNFRKIAELMVFANLIGHEKEYAAIHLNIHQEWNMGKIINKIKSINPYYYPYAWNERLDDRGHMNGAADVPDGEFMTEQELIDMFGKCSDLIHAHNPLKGELNYEPYITLFDIWNKKIDKLLRVHGIMLADKKHVICCRMNPHGTKIPVVNMFVLEPEKNRMKNLSL